jgi:hypothetical protein
VTALDLVAGSDFSDRILGVWRELGRIRGDEIGSGS